MLNSNLLITLPQFLYIMLMAATEMFHTHGHRPTVCKHDNFLSLHTRTPPLTATLSCAKEAAAWCEVCGGGCNLNLYRVGYQNPNIQTPTCSQF